MSATDELRRLLDERGVKWRDSSDENVLHTTWNGMNCWFNEFQDGWTAWGMAMRGTPEQAVAATLGRGNVGRYVGLRRGKCWERTEYSDYYCGGCGWKVTDHDSYCPECGGALHESTLGLCNCSNNCTNSERTETCHDTKRSRWFRCSECGFGIEDMYINDEGEYPSKDQPRYCPNCGRRIEETDE